MFHGIKNMLDRFCKSPVSAVSAVSAGKISNYRLGELSHRAVIRAVSESQLIPLLTEAADEAGAALLPGWIAYMRDERSHTQSTRSARSRSSIKVIKAATEQRLGIQKRNRLKRALSRTI